MKIHLNQINLPTPLKKIKDQVLFRKNKLFYNYRQYVPLIKKFKNIHKGERCFIVATGPSINKTNLKLIKNEVTFGVNSLYSILDKFDLKTNYYAVSDGKVWERYSKPVSKLDTTLFISSDTGRMYLRQNTSGNAIILQTKGYMSVTGDFSTDISKYVVGGHTVVIDICLQVAYYMGFKEVYLLGCDCDYSGTKTHFDGSTPSNLTGMAIGEYDKVFKAYEVCKKVFENDGRKIYNATVGGKLEVFERKKLEDVING